MGLQDRDYLRERHRQADRDAGARGGGQGPPGGGAALRYLLYPALAFGLLWYGADMLLGWMREAGHAPGSVVAIPGGVVLRVDRQGHFTGTALINGVPMPFMIDTGATTTSVPSAMARAAGLPVGSPVRIATAGGPSVAHLTRIDSLVIGDTRIERLEAQINRHLDQVLIGMSTLRHFGMTQDGGTLTLRTRERVWIGDSGDRLDPPGRSHDTVGDDAMAPVTDRRPRETRAAWRKTLVCDAQGRCETIYGDP